MKAFNIGLLFVAEFLLYEKLYGHSAIQSGVGTSFEPVHYLCLDRRESHASISPRLSGRRVPFNHVAKIPWSAQSTLVGRCSILLNESTSRSDNFRRLSTFVQG